MSLSALVSFWLCISFVDIETGLMKIHYLKNMVPSLRFQAVCSVGKNRSWGSHSEKKCDFRPEAYHIVLRLCIVLQLHFSYIACFVEMTRRLLISSSSC